MGSSVARQVLEMSTTEVRLCSVDFGDSVAANVRSGKLDAGELLTGTPVVTQYSSVPSDATALTLDNKVVNTAAIEVEGRDCAIGECVQFTAASPDDGARYLVKVQCGTDATPAQTLVAFVWIHGKDG